ncbi:MAG: hypothetical protein HWD86_10505 [Kangiellaceae bacterium]|nr:hypothetical protein [Kangiellaceae bacterium]
MKKLLTCNFTMISLALLQSCSSANTNTPLPIPQITKPTKHLGFLKINSKETDEVCFELTQGQALSYKITSSSPTLFNIHYHKNNNTRYPVANQETTINSATIAVEDSATYCLMWQGRTNNTSIEYEYTIY